MKITEAFRAAKSTFSAVLSGRYEEDLRRKIRGDVFLKLRDGKTGELQEERVYRNIVTLDASILIARLMKDSQEPPHGCFALAVGTGDTGWGITPPAPTNTQRSLYAELTRKTFANTQFIDSGGSPTATPTNVVDFTTIYTESEAVGPLKEMGILGGNVSSNMAIQNPVTPPNGVYDPSVDLTSFDTLVNYLTFDLISKPATSTLGITWRLTF